MFLTFGFFLSNKLDIFYFVTGIFIIGVAYLHFFGRSLLRSAQSVIPDLVFTVLKELNESSSHTSRSHQDHHWLAEWDFRMSSSLRTPLLCLNVLSARLNNLNICFYFLGRKRILIFLSKIISLTEFFWIWCILWKPSFVKYNWFFDILLMLLQSRLTTSDIVC